MYTLFLEHGDDYDTLWVKQGEHRICVRGGRDYIGYGYNASDPLHQLLDSFDPPSVSVLMSGAVYDLNVKNSRSAPTIAACDALFESEP